MKTIISTMCNYKIVPVVSAEKAEDALYVAEALLKAGLPLIEITFRTNSAAESISFIRKEFPEMIVGAGTVLSLDQAKKAIDSGAQCIVSPGTSHQVVKYALDNGITVIPGVMTPTEIENAIAQGLRYLKLFPAEAAGGVNLLKAYAGPYSEIKFMPTGGISAQNIKEYIGLNNVFACGGSWMVKKSLITSREFTTITRLTKEAINLVCER